MLVFLFFFFFNDTATTEIYTLLYTLSLHDALPISLGAEPHATLAARLEIAAPRHGRVTCIPTVAPAHSDRPALPQFERGREPAGYAAPRSEARRREIEHLGREGAEQRHGRSVHGSLPGGQRAGHGDDQAPGHGGPAQPDIGVGRARELERPAGGGGRGMRVPARQIHREARAEPMR